MSTFQFKYFTIKQEVTAVKVGTDAMLLGVFTNVSEANKVLEIGTGTGVISLMLAQKNPNVEIVALEIHAETALEAKHNVAKSPYCDNIIVQNQDFLLFQAGEKYDVIVTNPPYFENGLLPEDPKDILAKHIDKATLEEWFNKISQLLNCGGKCWMILPAISLKEWIDMANTFHLFLDQRIDLYAKSFVCKRIIISLSKTSKVLIHRDFTIRNLDGTYTLEYLELTQEFHDRNPIR
jgi:tRNA1Val (adenine37-N6)-methyltransferase